MQVYYSKGTKGYSVKKRPRSLDFSPYKVSALGVAFVSIQIVLFDYLFSTRMYRPQEARDHVHGCDLSSSPMLIKAQ